MEPSNLGASPASDQPAETFERQFQKMDIGSSQCGTISALTQELEAQKLGSELQIGAASAEEQAATPLIEETAKSSTTKMPQDEANAGSEEQGSKKPKMLLMGLKRSGKTSISNVVFRKMPPDQTFYLETTTTIQKEATHTFMDCQIWDLPGQIDYLDPEFDAESIFGGVGTMIWILDAGDNYAEPIGQLTETVLHLRQSYPNIKFAVFIHKVDSLAEDYREDTIRDVVQRITDDLFDAGMDNPPISYHSTSIYDSSIFEAFSKVMQALVPGLSLFEGILDQMKGAVHFEKVYLFDVWSKIYVAADTSLIDRKAYDLCSAFIDMIVDASEIYGYKRSTTVEDENKVAQLQGEGAEAMVKFEGNTVYLREIDRHLSLVGISKDPDFAKQKALMEHNIGELRKVLQRIMKGDF